MMSTLRIGYKYRRWIRDLEPSEIEMDDEAVLLDNLNSPLVRMRNDGLIEPGLAESHKWTGPQITFEIRPNLKSVDGHDIDAYDVEFTFKRLLARGTNAHGELRTFLCPGAVLKRYNDPCRGIQILDSKSIRFELADEKYKPFFLQMIANMDFGILLRNSCDLNDPKAPILDFRNTSGPYYLEHDEGGGRFDLRLNPNHWSARSSIPSLVQFFPTSSEEALQKIEKGELDFSSSVLTEPSATLKKLRGRPNVQVFDTIPVLKFVIATTVEQLTDLTVAQRLKAIGMVQDAFSAVIPTDYWGPSKEFFPVLGEGAMSEMQMKQYLAALEAAKAVSLPRRITIGVHKRRMNMLKPVFDRLPGFELVEIKQLGAFAPPGSRPDFYICGTDTGFHENLTLIAYGITAGHFLLKKSESAGWFGDYMSELEKGKRLEKLRKLNFDSVTAGLLGILGERPYTVVTRKPWRYEGSKLFGENPLWLIRRQD